MIEWITEPWTYPFMRWALFCCVVLAGVHAYFGFHIVRRTVLFADLAMAQMAALGAAVAVVLGFEHDTPGEYALSAGSALATAVFFTVLRSRRVPQEAVIAIFYGVATAATFVVLERSPHGMEEVKHLFVGQVLTVAPRKVIEVALAYVVIGLVLARFHGRITAVSDGGAIARHRALDLLFYGTFAIVVTNSVGLVGILLVFALLVLPPVAAILAATGTGAQLAWGWSFALAASLLGLHAAFHLDLPAAPVIVLTLGVLLLVAVGVGRLRRPDAGQSPAPRSGSSS